MLIYQTDIKLPTPVLKGKMSVEEALLVRRSIRDLKSNTISLSEVGQLLWSAQGVTAQDDKRTSPSAGALYPLQIYLVAGMVEDLESGVYHYKPASHALQLVISGDKRKGLYVAAGMQSALFRNAAVLVLTADYNRTTAKYGERAYRYVHMEAGHVSENIYLQATSLKIGTVAMGAFSDTLVRTILSLPQNEQPLYLMPIGK